MTNFTKAYKRRLGLIIWAIGMLGVLALLPNVLPSLLAGRALPQPMWVIMLISVLQSAVLLAFAVWAGVALAPKLGLRAPAFEALAGSSSITLALGPQVIPGLLGGVMGGITLMALGQITPAELAAAGANLDAPLWVRVLYGGITEELLLRWGLMTLLLWLMWRFSAARQAPGAMLVWLSIVGSALLFGLGHLPAANTLLGHLSPATILFVVGGNSVFGLIAGFLYGRHGLESAILAHAIAHVLAYGAGLW